MTSTSKFKFWDLEIKFVENYFFHENYVTVRGSRFSQCLILSTALHYSSPSKVFMLILRITNTALVSSAFQLLVHTYLFEWPHYFKVKYFSNMLFIIESFCRLNNQKLLLPLPNVHFPFNKGRNKKGFLPKCNVNSIPISNIHHEIILKLYFEADL